MDSGEVFELRERITAACLLIILIMTLSVSMAPVNSQEFPHIEATKTINPDRAVKGSNVEITITLRGAGGMILTPVDVALVMDRSGSMSGKKIGDAKQAAKLFLNYNDDRDRVALISYANTIESTELIYMTEEGKLSLNASIDAMKAVGSTDIYDALVTAMDLLLDSPRTNAPPVIILLTDGLHNWPSPLPDSAFEALSEDAKSQGIIIYSVGLGDDVNHDRLRLIAEPTSGSYYFAPTSEDLLAIYDEIAGKLSFAGTNIEVTETVPSYMTYNNDASKPPTSQQVNGDLVLEWKIGHLKIGEEWEVTYTAEAGLAVESNDQTVQTKVEYITAEASSAIINLTPGLIWHDIKVSTFIVEPGSVFQGELVNVTVGVENQGLVQDSFELKTSYNDSAIDSRTVTLQSGELKTIEFKWNTSNVEGSVEGTRYKVTVIADPAGNIWETNMTDNQLTQPIEIKTQPENIWWLIIIIFIVVTVAVGGVAYSKLRPGQVTPSCTMCRRPLIYDNFKRKWYCERCRRYYRI